VRSGAGANSAPGALCVRWRDYLKPPWVFTCVSRELSHVKRALCLGAAVVDGTCAPRSASGRASAHAAFACAKPERMPSLHPLLLAFLAGLFTFAMTGVGASAIMLRRDPSRRMMDVLLGFSAGVMLAAAYWSLLAPALEISARTSPWPWFPPAVGFAAGGLGLWGLDKLMPHAHQVVPGLALMEEGVHTGLRRSTLLLLAITLHHIPEGLALGVAAGAAASGQPGTSVGAVIALTLGLGVQNMPEGLAVSGVLRRERLGARRSALLGTMTGSVEPIAAVVGAALIGLTSALLPYGLAFAAGAMVFIVIEELVPECQSSGHADAAVLASILGFTLMTALGIALG
jgi:zinc transporter, ZIP family